MQEETWPSKELFYRAQLRADIYNIPLSEALRQQELIEDGLPFNGLYIKAGVGSGR